MRSPIWPAPPLMTKRCLTVFLCRRGWGWMNDEDCWCVMLTLPISFKCNYSKIYREINNSEVIRERIHAGQRCFDYQCVLLRLTRGGSFRLLKLITQLWLRILITVRSVTKHKAVRQCLPTSITYCTRFGWKTNAHTIDSCEKTGLKRANNAWRASASLWLPKPDGSELQDNKLEPRITDLTLKMTDREILYTLWRISNSVCGETIQFVRDFYF